MDPKCPKMLLKATFLALTDSERRYTSHFRQDSRATPSAERVKGTCVWLLDTTQYREWQGDENSAILWITGDAGSGKTTLMSFLAENLETQVYLDGSRLSARSITCCFFCT